MSFIKKMLPKGPAMKSSAVKVSMPSAKGVNTKTAKKLKLKK